MKTTGTRWKPLLTPNVAALRKPRFQPPLFFNSWGLFFIFFTTSLIRHAWCPANLTLCGSFHATYYPQHTNNRTCQQRPRSMDAVSLVRLLTRNRYVRPLPQMRTPSTPLRHPLSPFSSRIWTKPWVLLTHHSIAHHLFLRFLLILSLYSFPAIAIQDTTAGFRPKIFVRC